MRTSNSSFSFYPVGATIARLAAVVLIAIVSFSFSREASAQAGAPSSQPKPGDPLRTIPERIEPKSEVTPEPPAPPGSLSDKLGQSHGVIEPPKGIDPRMDVKPPPVEGKMRVIPPPGSRENPSPVVPK